MDFEHLDADQLQAMAVTRRTFGEWRDAQTQACGFRGSMVWSQTKGRDYLLRSLYDKGGPRRQVSLGVRSPETERLKLDYDRARREANDRLARCRESLDRQVALNRAVGLGRVPMLVARITRAVERRGLLGAGLRVLGTSALYAYEAAAGVRVPAGLLKDAPRALALSATPDIGEGALLAILQRVDRSFRAGDEASCSVNKAGFRVDLVKPTRSPAVSHETVPAFEAIAIDERGEPLTIVTFDPRVFALHHAWLARRSERDALERQSDGAQAATVAALVSSHLRHLPFDTAMLPQTNA